MEDLRRPVIRGREPDPEEEHRPLEPLTELEQVLAQREVDVVLGAFTRRDRLGQRRRHHFASLTLSPEPAAACPGASAGAGGSTRLFASSFAASRATTPSGGTRRRPGTSPPAGGSPAAAALASVPTGSGPADGVVAREA